MPYPFIQAQDPKYLNEAPKREEHISERNKKRKNKRIKKNVIPAGSSPRSEVSKQKS